MQESGSFPVEAVCHSAPTHLWLCPQRTQEMFQVKHNCYWNKPEKINAFPSSAWKFCHIFKSTSWQKETDRMEKTGHQKPQVPRARERESSAGKCALLCRELRVSSQQPHGLQFQGTWSWPLGRVHGQTLCNTKTQSFLNLDKSLYLCGLAVLSGR